MRRFAFLALGLLCVFALMADDSYLYWMIGADAAKEIGAQSLDGYTAKIGTVGEAGATTYLNLYDSPGDAASFGREIGASGAQLMGVVAGLGSSPSGAFFVELWNDGAIAGRSSEVEFQNLETYVSTMRFSSYLPKSAFAFGNFRPVPEPNSALMLLMGLVALALRRGKRA